MWPQAASCLLVFLGGIGFTNALPTSYGRFDPDRITEDVYRLRGFIDSNPVDIAGVKAWNTILEGFEKFAPIADEDDERLPSLDSLDDLLSEVPLGSKEENHPLDLKGFNDLSEWLPTQNHPQKGVPKSETNKNEKKTR
ncbi:unnamed protein product, partial [Mesorhabditis belari]|uniref:Uncharacterized protein n=1 Tax=Mesorhabditis belari TaxID=2138241 RepID=A0AAF3JAN1_9BILA